MDEAVSKMKDWAATENLGKPSKVMFDRDPPPWSTTGVALQWDIPGRPPIRNAMHCRHEDVAELVKRFEEWIAS